MKKFGTAWNRGKDLSNFFVTKTTARNLAANEWHSISNFIGYWITSWVFLFNFGDTELHCRSSQDVSLQREHHCWECSGYFAFGLINRLYNSSRSVSVPSSSSPSWHCHHPLPAHPPSPSHHVCIKTHSRGMGFITNMPLSHKKRFQSLMVILDTVKEQHVLVCQIQTQLSREIVYVT